MMQATLQNFVVTQNLCNFAVAYSVQTTLATFNAHLDPLYHGLTGDPEIQERTSLVIQQVSRSILALAFRFKDDFGN